MYSIRYGKSSRAFVRCAADVDLYFAPFDDVFVVNVDASTGRQRVAVDPRYRYTRDPAAARRARRHAAGQTPPAAAAAAAGANETAVNATATTDRLYELSERTATQLVTMVSVSHADMLLVVRRVRNRLVLLLPSSAHRLKVVVVIVVYTFI